MCLVDGWREGGELGRGVKVRERGFWEWGRMGKRNQGQWFNRELGTGGDWKGSEGKR